MPKTPPPTTQAWQNGSENFANWALHWETRFPFFERVTLIFSSTIFHYNHMYGVHIYMYIPASSKGCCLNPKGWCLFGTPNIIHSAPKLEDPGIYIYYEPPDSTKLLHFWSCLLVKQNCCFNPRSSFRTRKLRLTSVD